MSYQQFISWLDATPLSTQFKMTAWVVPAFQSVHILAIGVVVAVAAVLSLRLLGLSARHVSIASLTERLLPPTWWALAVLLLSGAVLIIAEPTRALTNRFFFTKMICLLLLVPLARSFHRAVQAQPQRWNEVSAVSPVMRPVVVVAMLLVTVIIFCGRWIAYA